MKICVANLDTAYDMLTHCSAMRDEEAYHFKEDETYKQKTSLQDTLEKLKNFGCFRYSSSELPEPLNFTNFHVKRSGDVYSASFIIGTRDPGTFKNFSEKLKNAFNMEKRKFIPTTFNGTGYVFERDTQNLGGSDYVISDLNEGAIREIAMGFRGAQSRVFPDNDEDRFSLEIRGLEKIVNIFVETCYSTSDKLPPNIIIEINP